MKKTLLEGYSSDSAGVKSQGMKQDIPNEYLTNISLYILYKIIERLVKIIWNNNPPFKTAKCRAAVLL